MVNDVFSNFYTGVHRRISSIAIVSIWILGSCPQVCMAMTEDCSEKLVSDMIINLLNGNSDHLIDGFDQLEKFMQLSTNLLNEGVQFLHAFIKEINASYGLNLTIHEACLLVRENLNTLGFSGQVENVILQTIALFESDCNMTAVQIQGVDLTSKSNSLNLNITWIGNLLRVDKKNHRNCRPNSPSVALTSPLLQAIGTDNELPGAVCAGGAEILAGALLCILGPVFPPAYGAGAALILDGVSRVVTGLDEMDKQRSNVSNESSGPFNVNF